MNVNETLKTAGAFALIILYLVMAASIAILPPTLVWWLVTQ